MNEEPADPESLVIAKEPWLSVQVVLGSAALVLLSFVAEIFVRINRWSGTDIYWFPVPVLALGFSAVAIAQRLNPYRIRARAALQRTMPAAVLAIVLLVGTSVYLMGWTQVRSGHVSLPGDSINAPAMFRMAYSIASSFVAGLIEEASIRGVIQFPLTRRLGAFRAQVLAGIVFVALHVLITSGNKQLVFVAVSAIVFGLLAWRSSSVWLPAAVHAISNLSIIIVILTYRSP